MKFSLKTLLYIVIAAGAIFVGLTFLDNEPQADFTALEAMREGDMKKLNFSAPKTFVETAFVGEDGQPMNFGAFEGQYTVVNFWATWCAPCRAEMPSLSTLQSTIGGSDFDVVTIATGRNMPAAIEKFFNENGISNLPTYRDPKQKLARDMAVLGLPASILISQEGREIGRLVGDANWSDTAALNLMSAWVENR